MFKGMFIIPKILQIKDKILNFTEQTGYQIQF